MSNDEQQGPVGFDPAQFGLTCCMAVRYLCGLVFLLAFAVVAAQGLGWLQSAIWQPVELGALFINEQGLDNLKLFPDNPLEIVPAMGKDFSIEEVAFRYSPQAAGIQKVLLWLFALPLALTLSLLGALVFCWAYSVETEIEGYMRTRP